MSERSAEILLVEDEEADIELVLFALKDSKFLNTVNVVRNGIEALKYVRQEGQYKNATRPDLILLDLNMPIKSGREVLSEIKQDKDLKRIPVAVMTSSGSEEDIVKSYEAHANCYIRKPININEIENIVRTLEGFWFSIVTRPPY